MTLQMNRTPKIYAGKNYEKADYTAIHRGHEERFMHYLDFLHKNGLQTIYDKDGNAVISSAMTRSIPPQATAFMIRIVRRPRQDNITVGRILDINRQNRSFTTISDKNFSSVIQFNVSSDAIILDRSGRRVNFSRLLPGMRVRIRHATFMTASIPPQTTAFEIRIL